MKLYKNIDVVQINIKAGVSEYFFPKNVDWANEVIDKMVVYAPEQDQGMLSPVDLSTPILDEMQYQNVYFDLYSQDNNILAQSLSAKSIFFKNNHPLELNSKISLQLSRIFFAKAPDADGCLLIYVFWGTKEVESDIPRDSVTIRADVPMGQETLFSEFIDSYIVAQGKNLKGIVVWPDFANPDFFITLRDRNYKTVVKYLPIEMCRPPIVGVSASNTQVDTIYMDENIDFDNSVIVNTERVVFPKYRSANITLYY